MTSAYQTLSNGTLVDYDLDDETGKLTIRAGRSFRPTSRPVILELERPVEMLTMINSLLALYSKATGIAVPDVPPLFPFMRTATSGEQYVALLQAVIAAHENGATHDCGEWVGLEGRCDVCGRVVKQTEED